MVTWPRPRTRSRGEAQHQEGDDREAADAAASGEYKDVADQECFRGCKRVVGDVESGRTGENPAGKGTEDLTGEGELAEGFVPVPLERGEQCCTRGQEE